MSFLHYSGEYSKENDKFNFIMKDGKKEYNLLDENYIQLADPTVDNTFKQIFAQNENITMSFLNDLLFPSKNKINKIQYLPTEHPGFGPYSSGSIRMDVVCKCYLNNEDEEDESELYNETDKNILIIDIEMQIGYNKSYDKRFLKYLRILDKSYCLKKVMVLALIKTKNQNKKKNISSEISFSKKFYEDNYRDVINFDDCIIFQIDLNFCYKLICQNKQFYILEDQYIKKKGKEWIKFLTLSNWCEMINELYFIFPPLEKIKINETQLLAAFKILKKQSIVYEKNFVDQKYLIKEINDYNKKNDEIKSLKEKIRILNEKLDEISKENRILRKRPKKKLNFDSDEPIEEDKSNKKEISKEKKIKNSKKNN